MKKISENGTLAQMLVIYQQMALDFAQKLSPDLGEQVANQILSQGGQVMPQTMGMAANTSNLNTEHPYVEKARNTARTSTQAD